MMSVSFVSLIDKVMMFPTEKLNISAFVVIRISVAVMSFSGSSAVLFVLNIFAKDRVRIKLLTSCSTCLYSGFPTF